MKDSTTWGKIAGGHHILIEVVKRQTTTQTNGFEVVAYSQLIRNSGKDDFEYLEIRNQAFSSVWIDFKIVKRKNNRTTTSSICLDRESALKLLKFLKPLIEKMDQI